MSTSSETVARLNPSTSNSRRRARRSARPRDARRGRRKHRPPGASAPLSASGTAPAAPRAATTLLAGLIDTHVHLGERARLVDALRSGLTSVVDLGTHPDSLIDELRADDGLPAIVSAGSAASAPGSTQIEMMGFPAESAVTGPDDAERFLDWRVGSGADLIKIIIEDPEATEVPALDMATLTALVDGAHRRGLLTIAHAVTAASFDRGLDARVDVLTHTPFDRPLPEATLNRLRESGTVVSPQIGRAHV